MRAERAHFERLDRQLEIVHGTRRTCEVEHAVQRACDIDVVGDVLIGEVESGVRAEVLEIRRITGDVIVHSQHLVAERQEFVDEM